MQLLKFFLVCALFYSCAYCEVNSEKKKNEKIEEMKHIIKNTSYCALIVDQNVTKIALPYNPEINLSKHDKYVYIAKVLETFSGNELEFITYEYIVEAGGIPYIDKTPYITCLCKNYRSYYVPDVIRFDYDGTNIFIREARKVKSNRNPNYCNE